MSERRSPNYLEGGPLTALSPQELIPRYVDAWNDPDPAHRRIALASLYADDGQIVMRTGVFAGIDAVIEHVTEVFGQFIAPGRYRFATGGAAAHHDCVLFHWELRDAASGELADGGMNLFLLSPDGRIMATAPVHPGRQLLDRLERLDHAVTSARREMTSEGNPDPGSSPTAALAVPPAPATAPYWGSALVLLPAPSSLFLTSSSSTWRSRRSSGTCTPARPRMDRRRLRNHLRLRADHRRPDEALLGSHGAGLEFRRERKEHATALETLVERAHTAGVLRDGVEAEDVRAGLMAIASFRALPPGRSNVLIRRLSELLLAGLRAPSRHPTSPH